MNIGLKIPFVFCTVSVFVTVWIDSLLTGNRAAYEPLTANIHTAHFNVICTLRFCVGADKDLWNYGTNNPFPLYCTAPLS